MNRHSLLQSISLIHAAKCNKSANFDEAIASFNKLIELKTLVVESDENDLHGIVKKIESWANSIPIVNI
jgi:hypothetical protein